jgi:hypothetical protein
MVSRAGLERRHGVDNRQVVDFAFSTFRCLRGFGGLGTRIAHAAAAGFWYKIGYWVLLPENTSWVHPIKARLEIVQAEQLITPILPWVEQLGTTDCHAQSIKFAARATP